MATAMLVRSLSHTQTSSCWTYARNVKTLRTLNGISGPSGHVCDLFGMYVTQKARALSSALPSELVQLLAFKPHWDIICQGLDYYLQVTTTLL